MSTTQIECIYGIRGLGSSLMAGQDQPDSCIHLISKAMANGRPGTPRLPLALSRYAFTCHPRGYNPPPPSTQDYSNNIEAQASIEDTTSDPIADHANAQTSTAAPVQLGALGRNPSEKSMKKASCPHPCY